MKHILNNLSDEEKNSILEQHKGGMKVITENFSKLLNSKLGDAKPLVNEQAEDQNTHRYDKGEQSPGIEKFFTNPNDETISNGLLNELRNDPYGKGKIVIIFNGEKFKEPGSFMYKIQTDFKAGKCYQITNYTYNNRVLLNTQIKITANGVECKKQTPVPGKTPAPIKTGDKPVPPVQKKRCKTKPMIPGDFNHNNEEGIRGFQKFCSSVKMWNKDLSDGTTVPCTTKDIDGKWGCCTQTCYEKYKKRKIYNDIPR
jgi:hypothetical protein